MTIQQQHPQLRTVGASPTTAVALVAPSARISDSWQFTLKHAGDRVVALLALLTLALPLLAICLAVQLSSAGSVIFRQRRVGRGGETFDLLKFRTMVGDSGAASFTPAPGTAPGGIEGADRRTAVGRWLRAISLDELPQLLNVVRGEMSIIGPRPERPEFVERFSKEVPGYTDRLRVKSGITGWAQANGLRGQTSIAARVELDNYYIENWSLRLELRILALTVLELLRFRDGRPHAEAIRRLDVGFAGTTAARASAHPQRPDNVEPATTRLSEWRPIRRRSQGISISSLAQRLSRIEPDLPSIRPPRTRGRHARPAHGARHRLRPTSPAPFPHRTRLPGQASRAETGPHRP